MMNVIFFNVDSQKDFLNKDGALYVPGSEVIRPKLMEITDFAADNGIVTVNTADCHTLQSKEIAQKPDMKTTFPSHCMERTVGQEFINETNPEFRAGGVYTIKPVDEVFPSQPPRNIILLKDEFDVFAGNKHTVGLMQQLNPDLVVVYGVASEICVTHAVLGLLSKGYEVAVLMDAIWALDATPDKLLALYWKWLGAGAWLASLRQLKWRITRENTQYV